MSIDKIGRNDRCPCGSGKKYKQCCLMLESGKATPQASEKSIRNAIRDGMAHHGAGRLVSAEECYQAVLKVSPDHPDALHLLGLLANQAGMNDIAIELIGRAIVIYATAPMHFNLGNILKEEGLLDQSIENYRRALELQPDFVDAHRNLGLAQRAQGRQDEAIASFRKAISLKADYAEVHANLGLALKEQGRLDEAISSYRKAIRLNPDYAEAHSNLGVALKETGNFMQARESYCRAIELKPDSPQAHTNLGNLLVDQGDFEAALDCHRRALALDPAFAEAQTNLGNAFTAQGRLTDAVAAYQQALALKPDLARAHNNLGTVQQQQGQLDRAVECFRQALTLEPGYAEAHYNLGNVLQERDQLDLAISSFRQALGLKPDFAEAHSSLGNALKAQSKLDEAIACYHLALQLKPDLVVTQSNLGAALMDQGRYGESIACFRKTMELDPKYFEAHSNLLMALSADLYCSNEEYFAEAIRYGENVAKAAKPYTSWPGTSTHGNANVLKLGLVSGDFRSHPVGFFLENVLGYLDRGRVELIAYVTQSHEDSLTARIKPCFSTWRSIAHLNDVDAARTIYSDRIDILIDLAGHTGNNRLPLFAYRPAPLQVSWLGYFASTGIPTMDYLFADKNSLPENHGERFTETVYYLPNTRLCFSPPDVGPLPVMSLPATRNGYVTFGCFQNLSKLNDEVLEAWRQIFFVLPNARLHMQSRQLNCAKARKSLLQRLAAVGVTEDRVNLEGYLPRAAYLAAYNQVDVILDTFPYPGGTTTCEALWMGVPTVTLAGTTMLSRQGASLLACAGLNDWVAENVPGYVENALGHVADLQQLAQLRSGLRQQATASALFDGPLFARQLEDAVHDMWRRHRVVCSGIDA